MQKELLIGITGKAVVHTDADDFNIDTRFRMASEAGVFDYYDRSPLPGELDAYQCASEKYRLPIRAGGFYYVLGRDEPLMEWHLRVGSVLGCRVQNVQIRPVDSLGSAVSNERVAQTYLWLAELGDRLGVTPCLEVHVNMWSEHFGRVAEVAGLVERHGVRFYITLDHSHVIFKIDNPREQEVQNMRVDVEAGRVILDPYAPNNVTSLWIERNYVRHAHARPSVPANPVNLWARHPNGAYGRGIQYPFLRPAPGEWHSDWDEGRLEPWKQVVRNLMRFHADHENSCLGQISLEMIPDTDYGAGAKYSIFDNNIACARWLRETWQETLRGGAPVARRS